MTKLIPCQYGESIEVGTFGLGDLVLNCDSVDPVLDKAQCENLAATIVGMSGVYDGKRNFPCSSGDGSELSPRRAPSGNVAIINSGQDGAAYTGEVILTPQDAMALAFELIRMVNHEQGK